MKIRPLATATLVGAGLQLAMVLAGHAAPALRDPGYAIGGMAFSAVAGWLYARRARSRWGDTARGGGIAGGVCGAIGIAVSVALGDVPPSLLLFGTAGSAGTGIVGAALAKRLG